jgi:hypothetical protein
MLVLPTSEVLCRSKTEKPNVTTCLQQQACKMQLLVFLFLKSYIFNFVYASDFGFKDKYLKTFYSLFRL